MESCIKPFLERCDSNNDGSISIKEWGICLGLKEGIKNFIKHILILIFF